MNNVNFKDFQKLDIRIGTVIKAENPDWSHWVTKLTVDLGEEIGERTIFAGIMHFYKPEEIEGKQYPFIVNLESRKMGPKDDESQGMLLAATGKPEKKLVIEGEEVDEKPVLFEITEKLPNGSKVR
jgi:methionine--tRNA ligase beta chain